MNKAYLALLALPFLANCTTTNTVPIAPDIFRLDTSASGLLFTGSAGSDTLLKAAQITSQKGYSHFKILDGGSQSGSTYAGSSIGRVGNVFYSSPSYAPTQDVSVVVQMLNKPAQGAWSVTEVIAQKGKMF
jgi:hypothetical protein